MPGRPVPPDRHRKGRRKRPVSSLRSFARCSAATRKSRPLSSPRGSGAEGARRCRRNRSARNYTVNRCSSGWCRRCCPARSCSPARRCTVSRCNRGSGKRWVRSWIKFAMRITQIEGVSRRGRRAAQPRSDRRGPGQPGSGWCPAGIRRPPRPRRRTGPAPGSAEARRAGRDPGRRALS